MTTVTGQVCDPFGNAARLRISFKTLSAPIVLSGGIMVPIGTVYTSTDSEGKFQVDLEKGSYLVTYYPSSTTTTTTFRISVPGDDSENETGESYADIASLVPPVGGGVTQNYFASQGTIGVVLGCNDDNNCYQLVVVLVNGVPTMRLIQVKTTDSIAPKILCLDDDNTYELGVSLVGVDKVPTLTYTLV